MSTIEQYVRNRRKLLGLTQKEVADKSGVALSTYKRQEVRGFDSAVLVRIAKCLEFRVILMPNEAESFSPMVQK